MELIKELTNQVFDLGCISKGDLISARHTSWSEPVNGLITNINEYEMTVQYLPGIGNLTNYCIITADETAKGKWEFRWSKDLEEVHKQEMSRAGDSL